MSGAGEREWAEFRAFVTARADNAVMLNISAGRGPGR